MLRRGAPLASPPSDSYSSGFDSTDMPSLLAVDTSQSLVLQCDPPHFLVLLFGLFTVHHSISSPIANSGTLQARAQDTPIVVLLMATYASSRATIVQRMRVVVLQVSKSRIRELLSDRSLCHSSKCVRAR